MKTTIALLDKKRGDVIGKASQTLCQLAPSEKLVVATPSFTIQVENTRGLFKERCTSSTMIASIYSRIQDNPQIIESETSAGLFEGQLYPVSFQRKILEFLGSKKTAEDALEEFLRKKEGDFAILMTESNQLLAIRDPLGTQPLYYGENDDFVGFATTKVALWRFGIGKPCSFPPGNLARANREGFQFKPVRTLSCHKPVPISIAYAAGRLQELLEHCIRIRVKNLKDVAVAFSGGLDSSVVAFMAKKCGVNVHLIHVSLPNQSETDSALRIADKLGLPIQIRIFENRVVEEIAAQVVELIEEPDPVKLTVGIPFYWIAQTTAEAGYSVLFAGQGADELFGGYRRYVTQFLSEDEEHVHETMCTDVRRLHETNLERDTKICAFHGVKLRLPFASYAIAKFALSLPLNLKIEKNAAGLRKIVLRRVAQNIGLPSEVVNNPKKAIQYGTGVNTVLMRSSKKQKLTLKQYVENLFQQMK